MVSVRRKAAFAGSHLLLPGIGITNKSGRSNPSGRVGFSRSSLSNKSSSEPFSPLQSSSSQSQSSRPPPPRNFENLSPMVRSAWGGSRCWCVMGNWIPGVCGAARGGRKYAVLGRRRRNRGWMWAPQVVAARMPLDWLMWRRSRVTTGQWCVCWAGRIRERSWGCG